MLNVKIGDDLLISSQTADRPNGQTDEQMVEAHSRVVVRQLGNSFENSHAEFQFSLLRARCHAR